MTNSKIRAMIFLALFLLVPVFANAAEVNFVARPSVAGVGHEVAVDILLDTEGKTVTALSGEIMVTDGEGDRVAAKGIRDGDSIIGAWLTQAEVDDPLGIKFSGIVPGGARTTKGKIITLYFVPEKVGTLTITFAGKAFFDAASGESTTLTPKSFALSVNDLPPDVYMWPPGDNTPPEDIRAVIARNEAMFDGKPFIIVHAKDAESGILMYELLEVPEFSPLEDLSGDTLLPWRRIENPEALLYPADTRYIYVRVTDREGNSAVALVGAPRELSPGKTAFPFKKGLILAIIIGVAGPSLWLWVRRRKNHE